MPRVPWAWILLGALGISTLGGGYWLKEHQRARELRAQVLRVHEYELEAARVRYTGFRDKLENWVLRAAWSKPREHLDPRLRIAGLRAGNGLYLRLYAKDARTKRGIDEGARAMDADSIAACLGLAPASARGVWEKGGFLMPRWADQVRKEEHVMRLRVLDEMLARHIRSDLASVLGLLKSQWFMLVLQDGPTRRDHPVDVLLWDIKRDELLLRTRIQARGLLVPMRVRMEGVPAGPGAPTTLTSGAATDCSIGSQLKALTGTPGAEMNPPAPPAAREGTGGAAGASLAVPDAGSPSPAAAPAPDPPSP